MKEYYDFLKEELNNFEGDFDKFVLYAPELFRLLCKLLDEPLSKEDRRSINSALAYFVVPNDVIPENIYGPIGYVDDIYVCTTVLNELKNKYGINILKKHWEDDEEIDVVLKICYEKSKRLLKEQNLVERVLETSGLK